MAQAKKTTKTAIVAESGIIANNDTFVDVLKRSNSSIKGDRAIRFGRVAQMAFVTKLGKVRHDIIMKQDKIDSLLDLSTDNKSTTLNALETFNAEKFVDDLIKYEQELVLLRVEEDILVKRESFFNVE